MPHCDLELADEVRQFPHCDLQLAKMKHEEYEEEEAGGGGGRGGRARVTLIKSSNPSPGRWGIN